MLRRAPGTEGRRRKSPAPGAVPARRNTESTAGTAVSSGHRAQAQGLRENTGSRRARPGLLPAVPNPPPPQPQTILQPITVPPQQLQAPDSTDRPPPSSLIEKYIHQAGSPLASHCQPRNLLGPRPTFSSPLTGVETHPSHRCPPQDCAPSVSAVLSALPTSLSHS